MQEHADAVGHVGGDIEADDFCCHVESLAAASGVMSLKMVAAETAESGLRCDFGGVTPLVWVRARGRGGGYGSILGDSQLVMKLVMCNCTCPLAPNKMGCMRTMAH